MFASDLFASFSVLVTVLLCACTVCRHWRAVQFRL